GTRSGNLEAARAKLGDREALSGITAETKEVQSSFGGGVLKLQYVGGKEAVDVLLSVLGAPTPGLVKAKAARDQPTDDRNLRFLVEDRYRVEEQIYREYQASILGALARLVKDPPLSQGAPPTEESFQKWKGWWAKNRDRAQLV